MKNQEINLEKAKLFLWEAIDSIKEHKRKERMMIRTSLMRWGT